MKIPIIWFWTYKMTPEETYNSVRIAIDNWYKHIDTAQRYDNEEQIWKAILDSKIQREKIRITSKLRISNYNKKKCSLSIENSLKKINSDYIDLFLLHRPDKINNYDTHKYILECLLTFKSKWKIKNIWVSNFNCELLKQAQIFTWNQILVNQIEYHPTLRQKNIKKCCKDTNTLIEAYAPFAHWHIFKFDILNKIAQKHNKTVWQIILKRLIDQNIIILPKSTNKKHIKENINIFNIQLDNIDKKNIESLPNNHRYFDRKERSPKRDD